MEIIKRYCIKPNFVLRRIAGEYAIVPVDVESELTNAVMQPNETAAFIWQTFQQPMTEAEVVEKVKQEFDAPEEVIQNAVHRFVVESLKLRILEEEIR